MKFFKKFFSQVVVIVLALLVQLFLIFAVLYHFNTYYVAFQAFQSVFGLLLFVYIINKKEPPEFKLPWLFIFMPSPFFGVIVCVLFANPQLSKVQHRHLLRAESACKLYLTPAEGERREARARLGVHAGTENYLARTARTEGCLHNKVGFFPVGEAFFADLLSELERAEKFIFLEYFIIAEGKFWGDVLEILKQKVAEGVDVRLTYDVIGSMFKVPSDYDKQMEKLGIKCLCFNRFRPVLDTAQNNRTHRKIAVIDGKVAFTGGINLSDEYTNETHPLGHWKDTGILVRGRAVQNFTAMFLQFWALKADEPDYKKYVSDAPQGDLPCLAFCDSPLDDEHNLCEDLYLRIIYNAKKSVYIYTPYLIPDEEMKRALLTAARSGVDVRIVIPEIPDKKYVFAVTKAFYSELVGEGIKIYRYTPGFIHAKSIVGDGKYCVLGTSNIDFRSFYLHFECDMMFFDERVSGEVEKDFLATCGQSTLVTPDQIKTSLPQLIYRSLLRIFAPLM